MRPKKTAKKTKISLRGPLPTPRHSPAGPPEIPQKQNSSLPGTLSKSESPLTVRDLRGTFWNFWIDPFFHSRLFSCRRMAWALCGTLETFVLAWRLHPDSKLSIPEGHLQFSQSLGPCRERNREEHSMDQCRSRLKLQRTLSAIGPYEFRGKFTWTNHWSIPFPGEIRMDQWFWKFFYSQRNVSPKFFCPKFFFAPPGSWTRAFFKGGDLNPGERHSRDTRDDGMVTLCTLCAATVLSRDCRADFGRHLTKKVMLHSRDGPGVTAPSRTNIVPLTRVWNPPLSVTPP